MSPKVAALLFISTVTVCVAVKPITEAGNVDLESLIRYVTVLKQTNQDSNAQIAELKSQLREALVSLGDAKSDLKEVKSDLKDARSNLQVTQTKVAVLEAKLKPRPAVDVDAAGTHANASDGGATFTRWGRTTCPVGNKVIYKGYTGGTYYSAHASTASILCLPEHPVYDEYTPGKQRSYIYGTEYETRWYTGSRMKNLQDEDMPCVVCESETKRSVIMVPARNKCPPGWNLEYFGYLMGADLNYASAEFICVDNDPETIVGGSANLEGQVLYLVESKCGSLPCPPYQDNWELTCAVCSR